ncbi:MAG: hypothetical protein LBH05_04460 [Deferribacteraceae bacterium]|jgi:hypothetical protein|nr:hypothetical protein [Deferribacteraceae bacterium]
MTKCILKYILLFLFISSALSCAGLYGSVPSGAYVGTSKGMYAFVHFKVEDGALIVAFENASTAAMSNLIINISQKTPSGGIDMQSSVRLLKVRNIYHIRVPLAPNATGEVKLSYFFVPKAEGGIGLSPYQRNDFTDNIPGSGHGGFMDDSVEFRVPHPH